MPELTINNQAIDAPDGVTLLEVIRKMGIEVPALCHLDGLPGYGACRLCLVEVQRPGEDDQPEVVAACTYPIQEGLAVTTDSHGALTVRRMMFEFLLARCPTSTVLREMAADHGVFESRLSGNGQEEELCILCGLCVRVCRDLVGAAAIEFAGRGVKREVAAPFYIQADACIGCAACAAVCPTGAVRIVDEGGQRNLLTWNTTVRLYPCPECGEYFTPEPMAFLKEEVPVSAALWGLCPKCRRQRTISQLEVIRDADFHSLA